MVNLILDNQHDLPVLEGKIINRNVLVDKLMTDGSIDKWFDDFTYRYWSSFYKIYPADDLLHTSAHVYVFEQYSFGLDFMLSIETLVSALHAKGRNVVVRRLTEPFKTTDELESEYDRIVDWFLTDNGLPLEPPNAAK